MHGPIIAESARKHGIADEDIGHAWRNQIGAMYYDEGFTMLIGPSRSAEPLLELGAVSAEDGLVIVHAMEARLNTIEKVLGARRRETGREEKERKAR